MKSKQVLLALLLPLAPLFIHAQFMTDYLPAGSPSVTSVINGVSVTETFPAANGFSRAVNTIQENGNLNTDIWLHSVNNVGVTTLSLRYGLANTPESAAALVRCPNGDFIIVGTTIFNNQSVWAFRVTNAGALVWSNRYFNPNARLTSFCIRQTAEPVENYAIAAASDAGNGNRLVIFKISAAGNLVWNFLYQIAGAYTDTPKSMFIAGNNIVVVGNRTTTNAAGATLRDLFAIAVTQAAGAIAIPYRFFGDPTRDELDPYVNRGNGGAGGDLVLTYRINAPVGVITTGRIAFLRLTAALNLINPSFFYWENNATNSYGHTIWPNGAGTGYDIGGGTFINNLNNPVFMSVTNAGVGGNYSRKWVTLNFQSTYMHRDAFGFAPVYEHHNFKAVAGQNSKSLMRNPALAAPCNLAAPINQLNIAIPQAALNYVQGVHVTQAPYPVPIQVINGNFVNCNGGGGVFKTTQSAAEPEITAEAVNAFRLYPTLLQAGTPITIEMKAAQPGMATVNIFNLQGQQVFSRKLTANAGANRLQLEATPLKAGSYLVETTLGSQNWRTKIVVE